MLCRRKGVDNGARNPLRLALLWARQVKVKLKGLGVGNKASAPIHQIHHLERQLSFDRTPHLHFNKDRLKSSMAFLFPCVPSEGANEEAFAYVTEEEEECNGCEKKSELEEEGIDSRAEKFIAEFYGEIRLEG